MRARIILKAIMEDEDPPPERATNPERFGQSYDLGHGVGSTSEGLKDAIEWRWKDHWGERGDVGIITGWLNGEVIAQANIRTGNTPPVYWATGAYVDPRFRRQGVATAMYDQAEKLATHSWHPNLRQVIKLYPEFKQTPDGEAFWARRAQRLKPPAIVPDS